MDYNEKCRFFDTMIEKAIINQYSFAKDTGIIYLYDFNPKDDNHMLFYHAAQACAQLHNFTIQTNLPFFKRVWFNFKNRKRIPLKKNNSKLPVNPFVIDEVRDFMNKCFDGEYKGLSFGDIYREFWKNDNKKYLGRRAKIRGLQL